MLDTLGDGFLPSFLIPPWAIPLCLLYTRGKGSFGVFSVDLAVGAVCGAVRSCLLFLQHTSMSLLVTMILLSALVGIMDDSGNQKGHFFFCSTYTGSVGYECSSECMELGFLVSLSLSLPLKGGEREYWWLLGTEKSYSIKLSFAEITLSFA